MKSNGSKRIAYVIYLKSIYLCCSWSREARAHVSGLGKEADYTTAIASQLQGTTSYGSTCSYRGQGPSVTHLQSVPGVWFRWACYLHKFLCGGWRLALILCHNGSGMWNWLVFAVCLSVLFYQSIIRYKLEAKVNEFSESLVRCTCLKSVASAHLGETMQLFHLSFCSFSTHCSWLESSLKNATGEFIGTVLLHVSYYVTLFTKIISSACQ